MKAKVKKNGDSTVFELNGNIDFETAKPFKEKCAVIWKEEKKDPKVVFNMKGLKFVGSSGLSSFIQTLREFNKMEAKPKFCGVGSEFKKLFKIYSPNEHFEIFEEEEDALKSFES